MFAPVEGAPTAGDWIIGAVNGDDEAGLGGRLRLDVGMLPMPPMPMLPMPDVSMLPIPPVPMLPIPDLSMRPMPGTVPPPQTTPPGRDDGWLTVPRGAGAVLDRIPLGGAESKLNEGAAGVGTVSTTTALGTPGEKIAA